MEIVVKRPRGVQKTANRSNGDLSEYSFLEDEEVDLDLVPQLTNEVRASRTWRVEPDADKGTRSVTGVKVMRLRTTVLRCGTGPRGDTPSTAPNASSNISTALSRTRPGVSPRCQSSQNPTLETREERTAVVVKIVIK